MSYKDTVEVGELYPSADGWYPAITVEYRQEPDGKISFQAKYDTFVLEDPERLLDCVEYIGQTAPKAVALIRDAGSGEALFNQYQGAGQQTTGMPKQTDNCGGKTTTERPDYVDFDF